MASAWSNALPQRDAYPGASRSSDLAAVIESGVGATDYPGSGAPDEKGTSVQADGRRRGVR